MYRSHIAPAESVTPLDGSGGGGGGKGGGRGRGGVGGGRGGGGSGAGRVFCFWCFCPGVAMQDLKALGVTRGGERGCRRGVRGYGGSEWNCIFLFFSVSDRVQRVISYVDICRHLCFARGGVGAGHERKRRNFFLFSSERELLLATTYVYCVVLPSLGTDQEHNRSDNFSGSSLFTLHLPC